MDRETELRQQLARLARRIEDEYHAEAKPLIDELVEIERRKPPKPIVGPDGKVYQYAGQWRSRDE